MPLQATSAPALPPITDSQEQGLRDAFKVLYTHFASHGTTQLPAFDSLGVDGYTLLAQRALEAQKLAIKTRKEAAQRAVREGVKNALAPHIESARQEKGVYDAMVADTSPAMRPYIKTFVDYILVPMTEVSEVFPQGAKPEHIIVVLKDLGYTVTKGAESYNIKVQLPFMAKPANAAPTK
jgi:hypothetical protein